MIAPAALERAQEYAVIYADPPWEFRVWGEDSDKTQKHNHSAARYYHTMSTNDLCALPISDLVAPDCCLFMWACWPTLPDALRLGAAWGFEYKTLAFDWLKRSPNGGTWHTGMGYWTRANSEPCLLFVKGSPKRKSKSVKQLIADVGQAELFPPIVESITVHSAKPFEAYRRIMALVEGPYLELFARVKYPGWDVWGNEAPGAIGWMPEKIALDASGDPG
jgi:N6-adenosine-specific RNA methylase IME4